jgi:hypothetical protein
MMHTLAFDVGVPLLSLICFFGMARGMLTFFLREFGPAAEL